MRVCCPAYNTLRCAASSSKIQPKHYAAKRHSALYQRITNQYLHLYLLYHKQFYSWLLPLNNILIIHYNFFILNRLFNEDSVKCRVTIDVTLYRTGIGVSFVCRRYHISKSFLMRWNKKFDGTKESLIDKSHHPLTLHPNSYTQEELK